jgi:hypothetical protein
LSAMIFVVAGLVQAFDQEKVQKDFIELKET